MKAMTVTQLIRKLEALKAKHGNLRVSVDADQVVNLNVFPDDCTIFHIRGAEARWVYLMDDDGGIALTKDGQERGSTQIVLT